LQYSNAAPTAELNHSKMVKLSRAVRFQFSTRHGPAIAPGFLLEDFNGRIYRDRNAEDVPESEMPLQASDTRI
jgi:hypothetical protein